MDLTNVFRYENFVVVRQINKYGDESEIYLTSDDVKLILKVFNEINKEVN